MNTLIVYDSFFGNTKKIAQVLGETMDADVIRVQDVTPIQLEGVELLILGSPTRAFNPSPDIKTFLKNLPKDALLGVNATAFDTRFAMEDIEPKLLLTLVKLFGYASKTMEKLLQKKGAKMIVQTEWFAVKDSEGPLKEGEAERAVEWAKRILAAF